MRLGTLLTIFCLLVNLTYSQTREKDQKKIFQASPLGQRTLLEFNYTLSVTTDTYTNLVNGISINNDEVWDDPEYVIPIEIPFMLNGHPISTLQFGGLGALLLTELSTEDTITAVFPYEMDLVDRGKLSGTSASPLSYVVEGDTGSRIMKIEWNNAGSYAEFAEGSQDMFINFQLWLYEGSNQVEFRFGEHLIDQPDIFFSEGIYMGITDADNFTGEVFDGHFFDGNIGAPELSANDVTIEGIPEEGTVYTLSLSSFLDVTITSENSTSFCSPNGTATASASEGIPPYSYLWSNGETSATVTNLDAGTYTVTVTDSNSDTGSAAVVITNVDPIDPNASATSETSSDADDGTATSAPTGGTGTYTFSWSNGESTSTITGLAPGSYTVTVTDEEGCTAEQSVIVNAFECLSLELVFQVSDARCFGACDGNIEILDVTGGTAPYTYMWSTGQNTAIVFDLCTGTYSVSVVDAAGCEIIEDIFVGEAAEFFVNAGATSETGEDTNDGSAWASPSGDFGPFTYEWSNGSTDSLITSLAPGIYSVTVTDSNGCTAEEAVEVYEFFCIGEVQFNVQDVNCFNACDGVVSAIVNFGGIGPFTFEWNTGETTQEIENLCAGFYDVTITDEGQGCELFGTTFVNQPPLPTVVFIDQVTHVTDTTAGAIDISAAGLQPTTYLWTGPNGFTSTEEDLTELEAGIYTIVVTDANGCTDSKTVEILDQTVGLYTPYNLDVKVFPNPASDKIYIETTETHLDFKAELISPDGRHIGLWKAVYVIDISAYSPGMYYLKCTSGDKYFVHRFTILP